ncbi:MAG: hypothetical protein EHM70_08030 [Chloroflexota bacterium]|nr:MAG: hypothetical protein EHM70_08030 [Chloroflexota bacterium]
MAANEEERMQILGMIESGKITPAEGLSLLKALEAEPGEEMAFPAEIKEPVSDDQTFSLPESGDIPVIEPVASFSAPMSGPEIIPNGIDRGVEAVETETAYESASGVGADTTAQEKLVGSMPMPSEPGIRKWQKWWMIPLWIGVGVTVIGAMLMFWAWSASGFSFWFACAWFPFLFGVLLMALAWGSNKMRWLHVRVYQKSGEWPRTIAISLPLPLRLTAWFLRNFGSLIPNLDKATGLDEMILALENTSPDAPFYVEVDEGENGERVEVFIG